METKKEQINRLREERHALILAHYYTRPEIQEVADFIGDSLALARKAAETDAPVLVMCGVHFMAETCKLLSPDKIVLGSRSGRRLFSCRQLQRTGSRRV